jgi:hypothetical protein
MSTAPFVLLLNSMISGFPELLQIAESWSDERTTDLFFFGTYDTSVRSLVNPKIDDFSSRCLAKDTIVLLYYYSSIL